MSRGNVKEFLSAVGVTAEVGGVRVERTRRSGSGETIKVGPFHVVRATITHNRSRIRFPPELAHDMGDIWFVWHYTGSGKSGNLINMSMQDASGGGVATKHMKSYPDSWCVGSIPIHDVPVKNNPTDDILLTASAIFASSLSDFGDDGINASQGKALRTGAVIGGVTQKEMIKTNKCPNCSPKSWESDDCVSCRRAFAEEFTPEAGTGLRVSNADLIHYWLHAYVKSHTNKPMTISGSVKKREEDERR